MNEKLIQQIFEQEMINAFRPVNTACSSLLYLANQHQLSTRNKWNIEKKKIQVKQEHPQKQSLLIESCK